MQIKERLLKDTMCLSMTWYQLKKDMIDPLINSLGPIVSWDF